MGLKKIREFVEKKLPGFAKGVDKDDVVFFHQDACAADYQEEEFVLLGKWIKYVGLFGKEIRIIGKNDSTIKRERG